MPISPMVIVWEKGWGFCNRLFVSAYGLSVATEAGQKLVNFRLDDGEEMFPATNTWAFLGPWRYALYRAIRKVIRRLRRLPLIKNSFVQLAFDGSNAREHSPDNRAFVAQVKSRPFTFIEGWPYLEHMKLLHTDRIRSTFTPAADVLRRVDEAAKKARAGCDVLVGVHIRKGDYVQHLGGKFNYSTEQYLAAMTRMTELQADERVAFLVCSNEAQRAEEFAPLRVTIGPGTLLDDLYGLAACDYLLGPPSTFSLWAAFYALKPIYFLKRPDSLFELKDFVVPDGHFEFAQTEMAA